MHASSSPAWSWCRAALGLALTMAGGRAAEPGPAIDPAGFHDATHHWRAIKEPERVMQMVPDQPSYAATQVREIAANILRFQRANGGWPKDYDMLAVLTPEQEQALRESHEHRDTTFDNHTTHTQVDYLARAFAALGEPEYRAACERGLDFMLAAQYANGGFPQKWPAPKGIGAHITFNDGVMIGILDVLRAAGAGAPHFAWLDAGRREKARAAVARGIDCLVRCQIRVGGRPTGWGQQHDEKTLETTSARTFELACVSPADTTEIVEFLLGVKQPSAEVIGAIDSAAAWLRRVQLDGIRVERIPAPHAEFFRHNTDFDVVVVADPQAPPLWARTIEVGTDRPIFASRDGKKVYSLAEVDRERRTGSGWYVTTPRRLLTRDYPAWQAKLKKS
jgi:PelA/Pel-15E family pectate lyase